MKKQKAQMVYDKLTKQLLKYNHHYFNLDSPLISDAKYDKIKKEILKLEKDFSFLKKKRIYSKSNRCSSNKKIQKN